jgi:hypothetical protein
MCFMTSMDLWMERAGKYIRIPVALGVSAGLVWFGTAASATAEQGLLTSLMCILTAMILSLTAIAMTFCGGLDGDPREFG